MNERVVYGMAKYLDAVVAGVGDIWPPVRTHGGAPRRRELPVAGAPRAIRVKKPWSVSTKLYNAVVTSVGHDKPATAYIYVPGDPKLPLAGALRAERKYEPKPLQAVIEPLYAVVAGVGHIHIEKVGCDSLRRRKVSLAGALRAKLGNERAVAVENLDAVVAGVGHKDPAKKIINVDALGRRKVSLAGALRAERKVERAVAVENLDAVVAGVGDGDHAFVHGD